MKRAAPLRQLEAPLPRAPRGPLWTALALSLAGLALSVALARLHAQAHAGVASFCAVSQTVNCDRVATSRFSVVLGLPVAAWGALAYALIAAVATTGLVRRPRSTWPAGLLFLLGAAAAAVSVGLALVSKLAIGAWCLLCAASWAISLALFATAWRGCRTTRVAASVRADLAAAWARPQLTAILAVALVGGVAVAGSAYPRYWERSSSRARAPGLAAPGTRGSPAAGATIVYEYSDYECPFCARMHEERRALLAGHPELKVVARHFPLDPSCNPAVKRSIHPSACSLARAGICADAQGRFAEMDDALFRNQREGAPVEALAARAGLDLERFRACLSSPETERRLQADVAAGIRAGVRATPSYAVGDQVYAGQFPTELLQPAQSARSRQ